MSLAEVRLWGANIGYVAWDPDRACGVFEYAPAFKQRGVELAPLTMPAGDEIFAFPP